MLKPIKLAAIFMALLMGFASVPIAQGAAFVNEYADRSAQEAIISEYFDCINRADWDGWVQCAAPAVRERKERLVSKADNFDNNVGILTISKVHVLNMEQLPNDCAPRFYNELNHYFRNEGSYACYRVNIDTSVNEDNGYFSNGKSCHLMLLVKENGCWYVGAICRDTSYCEEHERCCETRGIGWGFISYIPEPATVTAIDENGVISVVPFDDFIFNVLCNEIGNMGYNTNAVYANVIAIKMATWWAVAGSYHEEEGFDLGFGDVTYMSINRATSSNQITMRNAVNAMDNYRMVSSTGTGGKLFFTNYAAGQSNADGKASGILRQNGSNYLAKNLGYSWKKILRYYYDNSSEDEPNVGTIQILCIGSHSWGDWSSNSSTHWKTCTRCDAKNSVGAHSAAGTYQSNDTTHWRFCGVCGCKLSEAHTWIQLPSYYRCSVCGRTQQTIPGTQSLSK